MSKPVIRRSANRHGRVKVYGLVPSRLGPFDHTVVYIRSKNFRGCLCDCKSFMFDKMGKNRNCSHLRSLREKYGRYFAKLR
jgi:hypothetical protein